jgi:hypothetical protein
MIPTEVIRTVRLGEEARRDRTIATDVYWVMPGPRRFIERLAAALID